MVFGTVLSLTTTLSLSCLYGSPYCINGSNFILIHFIFRVEYLVTSKWNIISEREGERERERGKKKDCRIFIRIFHIELDSFNDNLGGIVEVLQKKSEC